jgi:hypothetical protein
MTTVVRRTFRSSPQRDSSATWAAIVDLLTSGQAGAARTELSDVAGIAASVIADQGPKGAPITATCDGPRTRIYCLYDEDAIDGADANEEPLGFDPLKGNWSVSLPCQKDDLSWVQTALKKHSSRITARDLESGLSADDETKTEKLAALELDPKGFFGQ